MRRTLQSLLLWLALLALLPAIVEGWLYIGQIDQPLQEIHTRLVDGVEVSWGDGSETPAIIYLWAEWCPVCKAELPIISGVLNHYPTVTIAMQSGDDEQVSAYLRAHNLSLPTIADSDGSLANRLGITTVPTLLLLKPDGRIGWISRGLTTPWSVRLRLWWMGW